MKKLTVFSFFFVVLFLFGFWVFVKFGKSPLFSSRQSIYKEKLLDLEKIYDQELIGIEERVYKSFTNQLFVDWLDELLQAKSSESVYAEEARIEQNKLLGNRFLEIKDRFLINFFVVDQYGELRYVYDRFDVDKDRLRQIALLGWEGYSVENSDTLYLTFPTYLFYNTDGKKLDPGYLVLLFDLKEISRRVFAKVHTAAEKNRVIAYRYGFVYNDTPLVDVEKQVSEIIDKAYEINNRWKLIEPTKRDDPSFVGLRLSSGVMFAYIYPSLIADMPRRSQIIFLVLFVSLVVLLGVIIFYNRISSSKALYDFWSFFNRWRMPPSIPVKVFKRHGKKDMQTQVSEEEENIVTLLKELEEIDKKDFDTGISPQRKRGIKWTKEQVRNIAREIVNSKELAENDQDRISEVRRCLLSAKNPISNPVVIAILEKHRNMWSITEYYGLSPLTVKSFSFSEKHSLVKDRLSNHLAVCIKVRQRGSLFLKERFSEEDYQKINGILFVPITDEVEKKGELQKKIKALVALG